jgi:hypothetical protein
MQDLVQFGTDLDESVKLAPSLGGPEMVAASATPLSSTVVMCLAFAPTPKAAAKSRELRPGAIRQGPSKTVHSCPEVSCKARANRI